MHSPDDRSWPVTADGVMDWEAVFENPDTGFLPMIALARSPEALKQTTLVIIRTLFSRKNDESNFETYTAQLDEIVPDDAPASEFDAMRAGVIELLRRIKQERQRVAAEYHASEKAAKDDERPISEDEKETGDEDPALRIGDLENKEELDKPGFPRWNLPSPLSVAGNRATCNSPSNDGHLRADPDDRGPIGGVGGAE